MKGSSMNTHIGKITIDREVVSRYAGSVAVECFGIVGMAGVNVKDGLVKPGNVLKVDSFLNHQMDIALMDEIGKEFYRRFKDHPITKVL